MCDVTNANVNVRQYLQQRPCQMKIGKMSGGAGDGEKTDDGGYTAARLGVCLWAVRIVRANVILIGIVFCAV